MAFPLKKLYFILSFFFKKKTTNLFNFSKFICMEHLNIFCFLNLDVELAQVLCMSN